MNNLIITCYPALADYIREDFNLPADTPVMATVADPEVLFGKHIYCDEAALPLHWVALPDLVTVIPLALGQQQKKSLLQSIEYIRHIAGPSTTIKARAVQWHIL